jgi:outer membrane biosynthesis protein TonB
VIRRAAPAAALLLAAGIALAACTPPDAAPSAWQQSVQTVAELASAGDYASALASLDALEADVIAQRDAGEITAAEADGILARIAAVRADLTTLAPAPSSSPAPEETGEPEPSETTAPEPTETAEPEPTETAEPEPTETAEPTGEPTPEEPENGVGDEERSPPNGGDDKGPGNGGPGRNDDEKPSQGASPGAGGKDG